MNGLVKLSLDFGPLLGFFLGYRFLDLTFGTILLVWLTVISVMIGYLITRKVAMSPLISGIAVTVLGGLTILLQDELFIKIKPTIVNLVFALILLGGLYFKKSLLRYVLDAAVQLTEEGWRILTLRWGVFFVFLAGLNEVIWRNFPTDFWVNFKVFGMLSITLIFTLCQIPLIQKTMVEEEK